MPGTIGHTRRSQMEELVYHCANCGEARTDVGYRCQGATGTNTPGRIVAADMCLNRLCEDCKVQCESCGLTCCAEHRRVGASILDSAPFRERYICDGCDALCDPISEDLCQ